MDHPLGVVDVFSLHVTQIPLLTLDCLACRRNRHILRPCDGTVVACIRSETWQSCWQKMDVTRLSTAGNRQEQLIRTTHRVIVSHFLGRLGRPVGRIFTCKEGEKKVIVAGNGCLAFFHTSIQATRCKVDVESFRGLKVSAEFTSI
jgi:hypothetical protein